MDFAQNLLNKWFQLSDKIRFLFVGGLNAGISYIIYSISIIVLGENSYQISLALAWIISSVTSFTTQKLLVFNIKGNVIKQYLKCCTTWVFSYLINAFVLETLVKKAKCNVYLAQIIATVIAAIFTYIFFKKFAFKRKLAK
jgi:putative flippase GtrA